MIVFLIDAFLPFLFKWDEYGMSKLISILQGKNAFCSNFEKKFLTSYPKTKSWKKNFLTVAIFYFSSEAGESMLIRQLFKNAETLIFIFKKGPLQHRDFSKNFQNFGFFWKISKKFEKFWKILKKFPRCELNQEKLKDEVSVNFAELSILCIRFALSRKLHSLSEKKVFDFFYWRFS